MGIMIQKIEEAEEKQRVVRLILEALPEWFEVESSREGYIKGCAELPVFCAYDEAKPVGFLCLKETGNATVELNVMGVLKQNHRQGIGRQLFEAAKRAAADAGYSFMQVKTVKMGMYPDYDATNRFYIACGFREFEVLPLWDEANPCQVYVMALS